jgi:hypothetical protein
MTLYQSIIIIGLSVLISTALVFGVEAALHYDINRTNLSTDCPSYTVVNGHYVCR